MEGGNMTEAERESYLSFAKAAKDGHYFYFAALVILMHDHISMFDLEVELIWKKRWSLVKVLYIINRYIPDVSFIYGITLVHWISDEQFLRQCPHLSQMQSWFSLVALQCMQAIMVYRIACMYRYRRALTTYIAVGFGMNLLAGIIIVSNIMDVVNAPVFFSPTHRSCIPANFHTWSAASWFLMLFFELVVSGLATYEGVSYLRESRRTKRDLDIATSLRWTKERSIVYILMRDSIIFPLIGLISSVLSILAVFVFPRLMMYMFTVTASLSPILGCRLILHLRDAYYQPFSNEMQQSMAVPSAVDLDFQEGNDPMFALETVSSTATLPPQRTHVNN